MSDLKKIARQIFRETLAAIDIPRTMQQKLARAGTVIHCGETPVDLSDYEQLRVVAFGKAAHAMAEGLIGVLGPEFRVSGVVSAPTEPQRTLEGFRYFAAGHPVPTVQSLRAGRAILDLLKDCGERALVFFLLSGGGSALVELPLDPAMTLEDVQALHRLLVSCGAPIDSINAVRKHLSAVKGGRLAEAAPRAMKLTYGVTDVPEGKESALASGPTVPDPTTIADAERVVRDFGLLDKLPPSVRAIFAQGRLRETPKKNDPAFARAHFQILLGMHDLFHPAHRAAEAEGFVTLCDNATDDWPLQRAASFLLERLDLLRDANPGRCVAVIADGEVSSPVTGDGVGGRNAAFVLDCVEKIAGRKIAVLSAGTDGIDGSSPAAGAVADGQTLERGRAAGLAPEDYFRRSDSFSFFARLEDAVVTGPTGNNLRDLRILLAE
jgi:hydroxypyruvate reductase